MTVSAIAQRQLPEVARGDSITATGENELRGQVNENTQALARLQQAPEWENSEVSEVIDAAGVVRVGDVTLEEADGVLVSLRDGSGSVWCAKPADLRGGIGGRDVDGVAHFITPSYADVPEVYVTQVSPPWANTTFGDRLVLPDRQLARAPDPA